MIQNTQTSHHPTSHNLKTSETIIRAIAEKKKLGLLYYFYYARYSMFIFCQLRKPQLCPYILTFLSVYACSFCNSTGT